MDASTATIPSPAAARVRGFALGALAGLAIGIATSIGQGTLPPVVASLANSSGSWSLAAFVVALALADGRPRNGAVLGFIAFATMLVGYVLATSLRGFPTSTSTVVFWTAAALVVGPVLGVGADWVTGDDRRRIAVGITPIAGILIGEGIYGLTRIADSTDPRYWIAQIVVGVVCLLSVAIRVRSATWIAVSIGLTMAVAAGFYAAYSGDLLALIP